MKYYILLLFSLGFVWPSVSVGQSPVSDASVTRSIQDFINPDGTLSNPDNFTGSIDMAGYQMSNGLGGVPSFFSVDDDNWDLLSNFPGTDDIVRTAIIVGSDMYVGGDFTKAGGESANYIARYDMTNNSWHPLGDGVNNLVLSMGVLGNDLYVGGSFTTAGGSSANRIARYDMTNGTWHSMGTGFNNTVNNILVLDNNVYAGGAFTSVSGVSANRIARYDIVNGTWHALGGGTNSTVTSIVAVGDDLYVGGGFTDASDSGARRVARYDMSAGTWHALGSGTDAAVFALYLYGDNLFVGGDFSTAGGSEANRIARYNVNTETWNSLGAGVNDTVRDFLVIGDDLYVGGQFLVAGGLSSRGIAQYDMSTETWYAIDRAPSGSVYKLIDLGDDLYMGGQFITVGSINAYNIVRFNISTHTWQVLGDGINSIVYSLAVSGDDLFVGGSFTAVGEIAANRIARFDMSTGTWHTLGDGLNNAVASLAVSGDDLYVGGNFTNAGGTSASRIARYDLSTGTWHVLGVGLNATVNDMIVIGENLYVGGDFTMAGGSGANRIARYNKSTDTWNSLGSGVNGSVYSLAVSGDDLYVGGNFTLAGDSEANRIARYDISEGSWHALGTGLNSIVWSLAVSGNDLYVGGSFSTAGGTLASRIARYDTFNETWYSLGSGVNSSVFDLAVSGKYLFVGGDFTTASGNGANRVARYDKTTDTWQALGSGVNGSIQNLLVSGSDLYVGGQFNNAGGKPASFFGRWQGQIVPVPAMVALTSPDDEAEEVSVLPEFIWSTADRADTYEIQVSTSNGFATTVVDITDLNDHSYTVTTALDNATEYFWRVRAVNAGGAGDWSEIRSFATIVAIPDQVVLTSPADEAEEVSVLPEFVWSTADGAGTYEIQVSTSNGFETTVVDITDLNDHGYTVTTALDNATEYFWRVRAVNAGGAGDWSETRSFTTIVAVPDQVVLTSPADEAEDVTVLPEFVWSTADRADTYEIQVSTSNGFATTVVDITDLNDHSYTVITALDNATEYFWRVRAVNAGGAGDWSEIRSFATIVAVPDQVVLTSPADEAEEVSVLPEFVWSTADRADTYEIQVSTSNGFETTVVDITDLNDHSYTVTTALDNATKYFWRVRAVNAGGAGDWSETRSFTTIVAVPDQVVLSSPGDEAEEVSVTPTFSWSATDRAETYELQVSTKSTFGTTVIDLAELTDLDVTDLNDPSYTVSTALDNATEYFWRVRAVNAGGAGDWSETRSFTTIVAVPDQVVLSSPGDEAEEVSVTPTFSWSATDRAETYELQVSTKSTFGTTVIDVAELTDLDLSIRSSLDNSTKYFWRVRAVNTGGAGDWSETRSFTTIVNLPDVITLTSPAHESTGLSIHPSFSWEPDPLATTYILQITTDPNFGTGVQTYTDIQELFFNLPEDLEYSTTYYWRVAGVNTAGTGAYIDAHQFTTLDLPVPIQPTVFYPVKDAQDIPLLFTFLWEDLGEGHIYDFELAKTDQYSDPIVTLAGITLTTFTPDVALDPQTQYFWRVRATNEYGTGEWNDFFGFTTLEPLVPSQVRDLTVEEIVTVSKVSAIQTTQNMASFLLTWSPPESDGGSPITNYRVVYREADESSWTTYNRDPSTDTTAIVTGFTPGVAYAFDVLAENSVGASEPNEDAPIVVSIETEELPTQVTLNQNYPNPFNPSTTIRFALPTSGEVRLEVYSVLGQRMAVLVSGQQPAGWHTVTLNASTWSSGTYIYRLQADGITMTRKFLLLK